MNYRKLLVVTFSALSVIAGATAAVAQQGNASDGFERASALFHTRQFRELIAVLDEYIPAHPGTLEHLLTRGRQGGPGR